MRLKANFTLNHSNSTNLFSPLIAITKNKGFIAGICLFILFLFLLCLMKRIQTIRNSKSALKKRYTKINELHFEEENEEYKPSKFGDLSFSVDYMFDNNILVVNVMQIFGLVSLSETDIDSYVKVRIEPESWNLKPRKTKIQHKTNNPTFSKKFHFKIAKAELNNTIIYFEVFDHDATGASDNMLGIVKFEMASLTTEEYQELPCEKKIPLQAPIDCDDGNGEICVVLRHFPTEHLLKATVLEVKRLNFKKKNKYPPIFVIISMFHKDKLITTKRTTVKFDTRDPYFAETFTFHLKPVKAPYVYLLFKVMQKTILGITKCLGRIVIGRDSKSLSGSKHWADMVANPRVARSSWHALLKD